MRGEEEGGEGLVRKKTEKKEALKAEKAMRRQHADASRSSEADPLAERYGDTPLSYAQSKEVTGRRWTDAESLVEELKGQNVLIRGWVQTIRAVGKKTAFLVLRSLDYKAQCVVAVAPDLVSRQMVKFATGLNKESIVDVQGVVTVPLLPVKSTTRGRNINIQVRKIFCISKAVPNLPFNIEAGEMLVSVGQDIRLNNRVLDLRTPANQGIFEIESQVGIIIAISSEGGSAVFKLEYKGQPACLAQSPQLHKQMTICGGRRRVFEIGAVYRAEDSYTRTHLCEFTGLDVEMKIKEHYFEVMDKADRLFVSMFDSLNEKCKKELDAIAKQYPFKPLKYLRKTLKLTFQEGVQMLKEAGIEVDPLGDLNTVRKKIRYDMEFYILYQYPLAVRPFYTMPCCDDPAYSNSFDVFIRGEEIISGGHRIHDPDFLTARAEASGIDVRKISAYIDAFRYGAPPHGGFGAVKERVVMLFCALNNIHKTSLYPHDPRRISACN